MKKNMGIKRSFWHRPESGIAYSFQMPLLVIAEPETASTTKKQSNKSFI